MDMDVKAAISLGFSILATMSTMVLWAIQFFDKLPNLRAYWVSLNRFNGHTYPLDDFREVQPLLLRVAVANHSSSPDAVLDVHFRVRSRDGEWLPSRPYLYLAGCADQVRRHMDSVTPLPVNLPPKQTATICRYLQVAIPKGKDFEACVRDPFEVEVELVSLTGPRFKRVIVKPQGLAELSEAMAEEISL
jgi:hypothetical protein